jgi:outer membrane protein OmpA-like peptidoglycan-associated protein
MYTIAYDGNGSTGGTPVATQSAASVTVTLSANTFTRTGYTFLKWNTNTGGTGTNYTDAQVINLTSDVTVTLFAQWVSNSPPPGGGGSLPVAILSWRNPASISYPTPLSGVQLNATANVAGTYVYTPLAGTVLSPGTYTLMVRFTPANSALYLPNTATVTLVVLSKSKSTPTISWADLLPIFEPTPLSSSQLNATCSVSGKLIYTPPMGTVLSAGLYALHVECDPSDDEKYNSISYAVRLVVNKGTAGGLTPIVPPSPSTPTKKPPTTVIPPKIPINTNPNIIVPVDSGTSGMKVTTPEAPGEGIKSAFIENYNLISSPEPTFSGRTTVSVTLIDNGDTKTILVPVIVIPNAPVAEASPQTLREATVKWEPSTNATSYEVVYRGAVVCETTETACVLPNTVGPKTPVNVIAKGNDDTKNEVKPTLVIEKPIPALVVNFNLSSATLTLDAKLEMKSVATIIKREGFTRLVVTGHTDIQSGVDNQMLSMARAAATKAYLEKLLPNVKFKIGAYAATKPVADNVTQEGFAANRRAEILVW